MNTSEKKNSKHRSLSTKPKGNANKNNSKKKLKYLLLLIGIIAIFAGYVFINDMLTGYGQEGKWVYIPEGATESAVKDSIMTIGEETGKATISSISVMGKISDVKPGAYRVTNGDKPIRIARRMLYGHQTPVKVIFNNIRTMDQLAEKVSSQMAFSTENFMQACDTILTKAGYRKEQFPAAFIPDSYEFYWTADAAKVVNTMLSHHDNFWTDLRKSKAAQLGLTPNDVSVVASIVEEESAKKSEHGTIARLYVNRLDRNMPLQADPTVKFAIGDFSLRRINQQHIQKRSPYNTYLNHGLPPGPIRIPEKSTLDEVLNCEKHDYIYMCAKEDFSGYHNFASDYNTHLANARRYQAELNKRGIKQERKAFFGHESEKDFIFVVFVLHQNRMHLTIFYGYALSLH